MITFLGGFFEELFHRDISEPLFRHGERIAQMVIGPVAQARLVRVDALPATSRGTGGFGSTGMG